MAEIISAKGTAHFIEKIIRGARERIVLISPYLKVHKHYLGYLAQMAERGIGITFVFRANDLKQEQEEALSGIKGVRLLSLPDLHAKCFCNEHRLVIGSMNLYEHSEQHNHELGIMLEADKDGELFSEALRHADDLVQAAQPHVLPVGAPTGVMGMARMGIGMMGASPTTLPGKGRRGSCIRCGASTPFDPLHPLCRACYGVWANWEDPDYPENLCHACGKEKPGISYGRPECRSCYKGRMGG